MIRVRDRDSDVARQVDNAIQNIVPRGTGGVLPTDPKHVESMFVICTKNWRTFSGEKPRGDKLARINAIYKQATIGDYEETEWTTPFEKMVLNMWRNFRGTPVLMAKRRYLKLLHEVDPSLLQIKAYHFVPWGFPTTGKGERICPYSNATKGCPRPLMDKYGHNLEHELDHNESLADFTRLETWMTDAAAQQRCSLGMHTPISEHMGAKFSTFFARPECGGFRRYTSASLHKMVQKVLNRQLLALVDVQNNPRNYSRITQVLQRDRFLGLQQYYKSLTGNEFATEVACARDSHHCNTRRMTEGGNHTHPVLIRMPPTDLSLYDALIEVRRECERLGVTPMTGPVRSIDERCQLLRMKVVDFHRKKMLVYESQRRQQWRGDIAAHDAAMLSSFSRKHQSDCLRDALAAKDMRRVCSLVVSGTDPSSELHGGMFPLMAAVLERSTLDVKRLIDAGADVDTANSRGMTALMWAVKRDDYSMVDTLLDSGADVGVEGCTGWTAMSIASRYGRGDIAQLLVETLRRDKIAGDMNADRVLNHRSSVRAGLTPVAIAAIHRNEAMVRLLMRLGARPGVKCHRGFAAGELAAMAGWKALGLWLQETRAFGANGVYTFADMNAENKLRVSATRMADAISSGATIENDNTAKSQSKHISGESGPRSSVPGSATSKTAADEHRGLYDVAYGHLEQARSRTLLTVKILQEGHAAPDTETDLGHTALLSAAYRGLTDAVRQLLHEGADPNYANRNNRTPLMAAAAAGRIGVVRVLLMHGADAAWPDIEGKVAGAYAYERDFLDLAEVLAVAAARGNEAALEWDVPCSEAGEPEGETRQAENVSDTAEGAVGDTGETHLQDWTDRVTKLREKARLSKMGKGKRREMPSFGIEQKAGGESRKMGNFSTGPMQGRSAERCPKCTLLLPCLHFASVQKLAEHYRDDVPEWRWNKRGAANGRQRRARKSRDMPACEKDRGRLACGDDSWWRDLYETHRQRVLPHQKIAFDEAAP